MVSVTFIAQIGHEVHHLRAVSAVSTWHEHGNDFCGSSAKWKLQQYVCCGGTNLRVRSHVSHSLSHGKFHCGHLNCCAILPSTDDSTDHAIYVTKIAEFDPLDTDLSSVDTISAETRVKEKTEVTTVEIKTDSETDCEEHLVRCDVVDLSVLNSRECSMWNFSLGRI